jgi:hypothetical protein
MKKLQNKLKTIVEEEERSLSGSSISMLDTASQEAIKGQSDKDFSVYKEWGTKQHKNALDTLLGKKLSHNDYLLIKHMVSNY